MEERANENRDRNDSSIVLRQTAGCKRIQFMRFKRITKENGYIYKSIGEWVTSRN